MNHLLATAVLAAAVAITAGPVRCAVASAPPEISVRHADELIAKLPPGDPWEKFPDGSTLAWGESHVMHALVDLYEATGDSKYLEEVVRRGDRLLAHRDDRRGVTDGSGQSRPGWSMASKYVVAEGRVLDAAGKVVLTLRSTLGSHNNLTQIEVVPAGGDAAGRFTLRLGNRQFRRDEEFTDLSLDPADRRFVTKVLANPEPTHSAKAGKFTDFSSLVLVASVDAKSSRPVAQKLTLKPIPLAYMGYLGVIYHPMLRLAEIVKANPRLAEFGPAAERFVRAAEESYTDASRRLWREGPNAGEGFYLCCEKGESFPYDNVGEPFNYLGRHTAAQLALHRLTGKAEYRDRAEKMARLFKHRLTLDAARDLYTWNYWYEPVTTTGWTPANSPSLNIPNLRPAPTVEDTSHGVLDIALVTTAGAAGVVFDERDLQRFARTLLMNVLNPERTGIRRRVDGSAGDYADYLPALSGWLELTPANADVYREIRRTIEHGGPDNLPLVAALLKWEKEVGGPKPVSPRK